MRILFLSQRFLMPMDTGGKIRTGNILKHLSRDNEITLISNVEEPKDTPYLPEMKNFCSQFIQIPWKEASRNHPLFYLRLLFQCLSPNPVSSLNDYSRALRTAVEKEAATGNYDIAICDFAQSALMFHNIRGLPTLLFQHNVESMIPKRHYLQASNLLARLFWWLQWKKWLAYEGREMARFTRVIAVSETDRDTYRELYGSEHVDTIPTGTDINFFAPQPGKEEKNLLVFCGSMDWLPNQDAVEFFATEVLPEIRKSVPDAHFLVVGRKPPATLVEKLAKGGEVTFTGWVEDTRPYLAKAAIVVVPIRIGGGTRMKIYEAMAMGKAVVSTRIGAEGLGLKDGETIAYGDNASILAKRINALLKDQKGTTILGDAGRNLVVKHYSWRSVSHNFQNNCIYARANYPT